MRLESLRVQLTAVFGIALTFVLHAAIQGVIGNRADAWLPMLGTALSYDVTASIGYLLLVVLLSLVLPVSLLIRYRAAFRTASSLNKIDDSLSRSIATLYGNPTLEERGQIAKRVTERLFQSVRKVHPFQTCGLAIYFPDDGGSYLTTWVLQGAPNESDPNLSFYIGDANSPNSPSGGRGVAGKTFLDGEMRAVHFTEDGRAEDSDIYFPTAYGKGSYRALICVAIPSGEPNKNLGVLCLYSSRYRTFNGAAKGFLIAISQRLSVVLEPLSS